MVSNKERAKSQIFFDICRFVFKSLFRGQKIKAILRPVTRRIRFAEYWIQIKTIDRYESKYENQLGIETLGDVDIPNLGYFKDSSDYVPTRYFQLQAIFDHITMEPDDVFVDIGCGKGRVLFFAAQYNIRKVIGIEMMPELADRAKEIAARKDIRVPIEVMQTDAAMCDLSGGTIFYMSNPFGEKTMELVIDNIRKSLITNPRRIKIVYLYPVQASVLDSADWLIPDQSFDLPYIYNGRVRIWHNKNTSDMLAVGSGSPSFDEV